MHEWFARYLQTRLEEFLPDPYADICGMLETGEPFAFSRFGDGELCAVFGIEGANRDGQRFHADLGERLRGILASRPQYLMGLQSLAVVMHGALPIRSVSRGLQWVAADALHNASMEGELGRFFEALDGRDVLLVGAPHHAPLAEQRSWRFFEVPYGDCWPQYGAIRAGLEPEAAADGVVFLFCASMTANVLIDDLHRLNPANTYIDAGSVFDPHVGVESRGYHEELDSDPLKGILA